jgi:S-formylglutathione hydrolase FrmB
MAAFYDPDPEVPLGFHLPMDLDSGEFDPRRWSRWLRHDPVRIVERATARKQLASLRGVFIDCGTKDQFSLLYGARILHERLLDHGVSHHYEEFDDNHSGVDYRMDVSLPWLYRRLA